MIFNFPLADAVVPDNQLLPDGEGAVFVDAGAIYMVLRENEEKERKEKAKL